MRMLLLMLLMLIQKVFHERVVIPVKQSHGFATSFSQRIAISKFVQEVAVYRFIASSIQLIHISSFSIKFITTQAALKVGQTSPLTVQRCSKLVHPFQCKSSCCKQKSSLLFGCILMICSICCGLSGLYSACHTVHFLDGFYMNFSGKSW